LDGSNERPNLILVFPDFQRAISDPGKLASGFNGLIKNIEPDLLSHDRFVFVIEYVNMHLFLPRQPGKVPAKR
jgi:hypothetical protein